MHKKCEHDKIWNTTIKFSFKNNKIKISPKKKKKIKKKTNFLKGTNIPEVK